MKKILILVLVLMLFTGCSLFNRQYNPQPSFGKYEIPNTWEYAKKYSTNNKFFYIHKSDRNNPPNNISVERGTNKYSKDNHVAFKQAILNQLLIQERGRNSTINGDGWNTAKGYTCYTFTIKEDDCITVQNYIVGDYEYILVHETIWNGNEEEVHNAAKMIVNSFTWN